MVFISTTYGIKTMKSKGWYLYFSFLVEIKLAHLVHRILVFIAGIITHEIRALHIPAEELDMLAPKQEAFVDDFNRIGIFLQEVLPVRCT